MKIVVLHHDGCYIEIIPVIGDIEIDEFYSWDDYLAEWGVELSNISYMVCTDDPDDIPVYWYGENIPTVTL